MMLGTLARRIYDRQVRLISAGARTPRVTGPLWDAAHKEAETQLGDREGNRAWRTKFADLVDRREKIDQPHGRRRRGKWKHGPGRRAIWVPERKRK